jgi:hypothetical protein
MTRTSRARIFPLIRIKGTEEEEREGKGRLKTPSSVEAYSCIRLINRAGPSARSTNFKHIIRPRASEKLKCSFALFCTFRLDENSRRWFNLRVHHGTEFGQAQAGTAPQRWPDPKTL